MLSIGGTATVQQALEWKNTNNLTFPVLADPNQLVSTAYAFYGFPFYPWDAIVNVDDTLAYSANSYEGEIWRIEEIVEVLESLFHPQISANPNALDFGQVEVGQTELLPFWLSNSGTGRLDFSISSASPIFNADPSLGMIWAVDDSTQITVIFAPTEPISYNSYLTIFSPRDTATVEVSGMGIPMGVKSDDEVPQEFQISCYPNPFNAELGINISLERAENVSISLLNVAGRQQSRIWNGSLSAGSHDLHWSDPHAPSGIYLLKVTGDSWNRTQKVVLIR